MIHYVINLNNERHLKPLCFASFTHPTRHLLARCVQVQLSIGDCIRIHVLANIIPARTITNVHESLSPEDSGDLVGFMVSALGSLKFVVEGSSEIDGSGEIVGCFVGSFVGVAVAAVGGETNPLVGSNDGYDDGWR